MTALGNADAYQCSLQVTAAEEDSNNMEEELNDFVMQQLEEGEDTDDEDGIYN